MSTPIPLTDSPPLSTVSYQEVRETLLQGNEIALIDVREEDPYA